MRFVFSKFCRISMSFTVKPRLEIIQVPNGESYRQKEFCSSRMYPGILSFMRMILLDMTDDHNSR